MNLLISRILCMIWGFGSGIVISTGIVAFITAIGIIPRLVTKVHIKNHYYAIGSAAVLGACVGTLLSTENIRIYIPLFLVSIWAFAFGIFVGCFAVALAEVMNVMPVMDRRLHIKKAVYLFIIAFAIGKLVGALLYWQYPDFLIL